MWVAVKQQYFNDGVFKILEYCYMADAVNLRRDGAMKYVSPSVSDTRCKSSYLAELNTLFD